MVSRSPRPGTTRRSSEEILPPLDAALTADEKRGIRLLNLAGARAGGRERAADRGLLPAGHHRLESARRDPLRRGADRPPAIADYMQGLATAFADARRRYPWVGNVTVAIEPGAFWSPRRCTLPRVYTVKEGMAILDGSTSLVGYDRFGTERFPVVNLSRPGSLAPVANPCYGALCDPGDFLGENLYGESPGPGRRPRLSQSGRLHPELRAPLHAPHGPRRRREPDGSLILEKDLEPLATWLGTDLGL